MVKKITRKFGVFFEFYNIYIYTECCKFDTQNLNLKFNYY